MIITLFRSRLTSQAGDDYSTMATEMFTRARTYPGFIAMKEFEAEDGERLAVVWWENDELQAAWRRDERHHVAQNLGRERWYDYYTSKSLRLFGSSGSQGKGVPNEWLASGSNRRRQKHG